MKTIKRERQVRLDELLKYVWDNGIASGEFRSEKSNKVFIDCDRWVLLDCGCVTPDERFTITEEVEITESTILEEMVIVRTIEYKNGDIQKIITLATHKSINDVKGEEDWNKKSILHEVWTVKGNGMGELIWTKERGLID